MLQLVESQDREKSDRAQNPRPRTSTTQSSDTVDVHAKEPADSKLEGASCKGRHAVRMLRPPEFAGEHNDDHRGHQKAHVDGCA